MKIWSFDRKRGATRALVLMATLAVAGGAPASSHAAAPAFGFTIRITLSENAARTLRASGERITASAVYYGYPKPGAEKHADSMDQIPLGEETHEITGDGLVRITGKKVRADRLKFLLGQPKVNVNVFSARLTHKDNILSCDFIDGDVTKVSPGETTLHCALIVENYNSVIRP